MSWTALFFGVLVLIVVASFAYLRHPDQTYVFSLALIGSAAGLLYSTLDHDLYTFKPPSVNEMSLMRGAYLALRVAIPTAIGYGASYVALFGSGENLLKQSALAFATAYIADASKLITK